MARKRKPEEHVNHERWLVSYADFITLLFAFFTTLYAISTVDQKKAGKFMTSMVSALNIEFFPKAMGGASPFENAAMSPIEAVVPVRPQSKAERGEAQRQRFNRISEELKKLVANNNLGDRISVRMEPRGLVVTLQESGFFESGKADLKSDALAGLTAVAKGLAEQKNVDLTVEGHTDNVPIHNGRYGSNWELSTARATFLMDFLVAREDFDPAHLAVAGYGEHRPVEPNTTPEGRAHNRRVDIVVRPIEESVPFPNRQPEGLEGTSPLKIESPHASVEAAQPALVDAKLVKPEPPHADAITAAPPAQEPSDVHH